MLVAPFSPLPPSNERALSRHAHPRTRDELASTLALAWLVGGAAVVFFVPFARGDGSFGATLPFWLVAAPLIDLAWIHRARIARRFATLSRATAPRPRPARNVRRQRVGCAAACSAARS